MGKSRLVLLSVAALGVMFLGGCANTKAESDLVLKEKCAGYNSIEKKRMKEELSAKGMVNDPHFDGIFYSKKLNSCVSEWFFFNLGKDELGEEYRFYDVLTENMLTRFNMADIEVQPPKQENNNKRVEKYIEEIQLIQ